MTSSQAHLTKQICIHMQGVAPDMLRRVMRLCANRIIILGRILTGVLPADNTVAEGTADAPYKKHARSPGLNGLFNSKRMEMIRWFIFILLIKLMAEVIHRSRSIDLGGHVEQYDHGTVHPPYPFESEMVEEDGTLDENALEDAPHSAVICGAVKEFGHTHLLEQTRNLPDTIVNGRDDMASNEVEHRETVGKEVISATYQSQQPLLAEETVAYQSNQRAYGSPNNLNC